MAVPVDGSHPRPGLLLEWRKVERGRFEGLVTYAALLRPGRWTTVTEWVPAELLTQADESGTSISHDASGTSVGTTGSGGGTSGRRSTRAITNRRTAT